MNRAEFISSVYLEETKRLLYVKGYKYQSRCDMVYKTDICPKEDIITDLIMLRTDGWIWISKYFAWDGCSGPTYDDCTNTRGCQLHDALYALIRMKLLPISERDKADKMLFKMMKKDGALPCRCKYYYEAVSKLAEKAAIKPKKIYAAPRKC